MKATFQHNTVSPQATPTNTASETGTTSVTYNTGAKRLTAKQVNYLKFLIYKCSQSEQTDHKTLMHIIEIIGR